MKTNEKAIAYVRVSSYSQYSAMRNQEDEIKDFAKKNGIKIVKTFSTLSTRYAKSELRAAVNFCQLNPKIKYLFVIRFDRISRNLEDYLFWQVAFRECDVRIVSVTQPTDTSPIGQFTKIMSVMSGQLTSREHSERVKEGLRRKKAARA